MVIHISLSSTGISLQDLELLRNRLGVPEEPQGQLILSLLELYPPSIEDRVLFVLSCLVEILFHCCTCIDCQMQSSGF